MSTNLTRRSVAKGAAWSVPAMTVAAAAPALAVSGPTVSAKICSIDHGFSGSSNNESSYKVYLGYNTSTGTVPAGTTFTYTFTLGQGQASFADSEVPDVSTDPTGGYTLSVTPASGTVAKTFTVTMTINKDLSAANSCGAYMVWNTNSSIRGGTQIGFTGAAAGSVTSQKSGVAWQVGRRYGTSGAPQLATKFLSKSDAQTCFPDINYTYGNHSSASWTTCGDGNGANDTSTQYPDGTCMKLALTTGSSGVVSHCG